MAELKICRVCLRTAVKLYRYDQYYLKSYYEEVMATKIDWSDDLPPYFCYECAALLYKFHKFKHKCATGQKVLIEIQWEQPISYKVVNNINKRLHNLESDLEPMLITKLVKALSIKKEHEEIIDSGKDQKPISNLVPFVEDDNYDNHPSYFNETACETEPRSSLLSVHAELKPEMAKNNIIKKVSEEKSNTELLDSAKVKKKRIRKKREKVIKNKKTSSLDMTLWKIQKLTEEEGESEFKKREHNPKYLKAAYHCVNCFRGFSKQYMLERHNQARHNETIARRGPWQCRLCHSYFKSASYRNNHYDEHFVKYDCIKCGLVVWSEVNATLHQDKHKGVKKKCQHCDKEFRHLSSYYTHLRMSHRSQHLCNQCGASFVSKLGLAYHKKKCKVKFVTKKEAQKSQKAENLAVLDIETYCEKCHIQFETKLAFQEHLKNSVLHGGDNCNEQNQIGSKKVKRIFTGTNQPKPTTCYQCGKSFSTQSAALIHHKAAHPRTSFCPPGERSICTICGASLFPGSVKAHENLHTKEKRYTCKICGKSFLHHGLLKRHDVVHTGEKPYKCTSCDKRFTQHNSMMLHYKTFHLKQPYPKRNRKKQVAGKEPSILHLGESSN